MPTDIQNSERLLDLSNQLNDSINERKKLLKGLNAEEQQYFATVKQQQKLSQDITANAEKYLGYQIKSKDLSRQIKATEDNINKSKASFQKIQGNITKQYQDAIKANSILLDQIDKENKLNARSNNLVDTNKTIFQDLLKRRERGEQVSLRELAIARRRLKDAQEEVRNSDRILKDLQERQQKQENIAKTAAEIIKNGKETLDAQEKELAFLRENEKIRKRIEKSTGLLGAFSKSLSKIPGIGQYINADEAIDEMEKLAASIEESGGKATSFSNRLKIGLKGASVLAKGFIENIKSPEAIFTFIVTQATKANKQAVELGKALGYGVERANKLRENFALIAGISSNINVNSQSLVEAFNELSQATGLAYEFSADQLETQVKLTKQVGLQAEDAAQVQKFAVLTGKTSEETYRSFVRGLAVARNQLKVGINFKSALAEALKVSGQLAANLGYNPERISKAIVAMKAFGTTLEQTKSQGEALLNFESSIENELKAELLTGQQLNLERARAAALQGDQVALAKELANQGMTLEKFQKMNVLAQKSYAEAIGLSADQLSDQLQKQKQAQESGKSLAQITEEEAAQALERQKIQDKFNAALLKIQDVVGNLVAGPFGQLFDLISNIASILTTVISPVITGISYVVGLIVDGFKTLSPILLVIGGLIAAMNAKLLKNAILSVAQGAWKALGSIIPAGPILATAATLAGVGLVKRLATADDMVSPGYGKRVLSSPEGSIALNDKDTIVAGTNLGGGNKGESITPQIDLTPMITAINAVKASVDKLYNKDTSINMDGKSVGTTLSQKSYKPA